MAGRLVIDEGVGWGGTGNSGSELQGFQSRASRMECIFGLLRHFIAGLEISQSLRYALR